MKNSSAQPSLKTNIHIPCTTWVIGGPFNGLCGNDYSLVVIGVYKHSSDTAQAWIEIGSVLKQKNLANKNISAGDKLLINCATKVPLNSNEKVMLFAYEYEGDHSISGSESLIITRGLRDPMVSSIQTYIKNNQNPLSIKKDLPLWTNKGFGKELKQLIDCREAIRKLRNGMKRH